MGTLGAISARPTWVWPEDRAGVLLAQLPLKRLFFFKMARTQRTLRARVHGRVGVYARRLMWLAIAKAAAVLAVGGLGTYLLPHFGVEGPLQLAPLAIGLGMAQHFRGQAAKASAGIRSERRALSVLRSQAQVVICGLKPERSGDLDLIAVGPSLVMVEVKTGRGRVAVMADGRLQAGGKTLPGNPVRQAARGAARAEGIVREARGRSSRFVPVVCVVDMEGAPLRVERRDGEVWVCSLRDLGRVVASQLPTVAGQEIEEVVAVLLAADERQKG